MIITIARQCGCGALHIGEQLAARYDIPFYTRKSLLEMARAKGVLAEMDDFFEERPVDELQFAISALGHDEGPLHSRALDILSDMIGQSECIIVGRCGNYIFRHRSDLVSVFLKGREADRIRAVAAEEGVTPRKAAAIVHDMDDEARQAAYRADITYEVDPGKTVSFVPVGFVDSVTGRLTLDEKKILWPGRTSTPPNRAK